MKNIKNVGDKIKKISLVAKGTILNNRVNAFWWTGKKNFGDLLTPELISSYGFTPIETTVDKADFVGVGSLLHMVPTNYEGVILGSGLIEDIEINLSNATFAAVRGEFTKEKLGLPTCTPTGDMGLLANKLIDRHRKRKRFSVGIVPHFVDKHHPWIGGLMQTLGNAGCVIDVQDSAANVIRKISECELIVSSSLHGIIVSDALNISNVWVELSEKVIGAGFKFRDYNSSIDYEQRPLKVSPSTNMAEVENFASDKSPYLISEKIKVLDEIFQKNISKK